MNTSSILITGFPGQSDRRFPMAVTPLVSFGRRSCLPGGSKMSLDGHDPNMDVTDSAKRSERKRRREQQRRFDLTTACNELTTFMAQIAPEDGDQDVHGKKRRKRSGEGDEAGGATRLDLIGRALKLMKRLHAENEELKAQMSVMRERGGSGPSTSNDNNVLVMVPTLTPVNDDYTARASYPYSQSYFHHGSALGSHHGPQGSAAAGGGGGGSTDYGRMPQSVSSSSHYQSVVQGWGPQQPRYGGPSTIHSQQQQQQQLHHVGSIGCSGGGRLPPSMQHDSSTDLPPRSHGRGGRSHGSEH